jgi:glutathione S-transferase
VDGRLYVLPGSHPSMAARLMLERKGIPYKRIDLVNVASRGILRALGFPRPTVPALKLDGKRVQGSREIARALEEVRPEPPLFPSDPDRRRAVEDAERWGDETLQPMPRRLTWWAIRRDRSTVGSFLEGARLPLPIPIAVKTVGPIALMSARINKSTDELCRADLAALPAVLDEVDRLIASGVIGGDEPNAADYQIATSVRLLLASDDVKPFVEGRPAGAHAMRLVPDFPGRIPAIFPAEWLEPLRSAAPAAATA